MYPTGEAELSIGKINWAWTESSHAHISTKAEHYVTVRGIQYSIGLHLFLIDGEWRIRHRHDLYASRTTFDKRWNTPPSESARNTILEHCTAFWRDFVRSHPHLAIEAERTKLRKDIDRLDTEIADLESTLNDKRTLRQGTLDALSALVLKAS